MEYQNSRQHCFRAKELRKQAPETERLVWNALSALRQETGLKFRRQHPLHPYIADFACISAYLIIELDGSSHDAQQTYDTQREAELKRRGWYILRFTNEEVFGNLEGVVETILKAARERLLQPSALP